MNKGYWIVLYRSITNPAAVSEYAPLAGSVIAAAGGRVLVRGGTVHPYEAGIAQRSVVIEFESVGAAVRTYESPEYQTALRKLDGAVERDVRIVEGIA
jgi:uncharacterized protein (DUF1330 family)